MLVLTTTLRNFAVLNLSENEAVQESSVRMAAEGVARKWRLWAGRVEWSAKVSRLGARIERIMLHKVH